MDNGDEKIFSVTEFLDLLNLTIKPLNATVIGEVGRIDERGQAVYFTLKDKTQDSLLNCFAWLPVINNIGFTLREGMEVKVIGCPEIYKPIGKLSLHAQYIVPVGEGALKMAFEKLKKELEDAGYFRQERKRSLPRFVQRIGLITSETGAAIKDFTTHLGKYGFKINFYDVRVEGIRAVESVVEAIHWFNENTNDIDVLAIIRGGGSMESLQAFNSVEVAKAIYGSRIPVLTAIGHERDETIADLVADLKVAVPTRAGEVITEPWDCAVRELDEIERLSLRSFKNLLNNYLTSLNNYQNNLLNIFSRRMDYFINDVDEYSLNLIKTFTNLQNKIKDKIDLYEELLNKSNPLQKLKQGYSIIKDAHGRVLKSTKQVRINDIIAIKLFEGGIQSEVKGIK